MAADNLAMPLPSDYPWHDGLWRGLTGRRERLPHALLLQGPMGLGKAGFAYHLARALLCLRGVAAHNYLKATIERRTPRYDVTAWGSGAQIFKG